uniref:Uncharacterized protein n=1 Tax=Fagus sylvatica TaxID=28930 RepID=A0A2N9HRS2_FAGSY
MVSAPIWAWVCSAWAWVCSAWAWVDGLDVVVGLGFWMVEWVIGVLGGVVVVAGFWMVEWITGVEKRRRKEK